MSPECTRDASRRMFYLIGRVQGALPLPAADELLAIACDLWSRLTAEDDARAQQETRLEVEAAEASRLLAERHPAAFLHQRTQDDDPACTWVVHEDYVLLQDDASAAADPTHTTGCRRLARGRSPWEAVAKALLTPER